MCGRYTITRGQHVLEIVPNVTIRADLRLVPRWNVAPSQPVPAILNTLGLDARHLFWGLVPRWAKDVKIAYKMINARAETLAEKPAYRDALRRRRCLLPADGFFEWKKNNDGTKTPMYIRMKGGRPFCFAGLWEQWGDDRGNELETCTVVTTTPNTLLQTIHDRMPVIVPAEGYLDWLRPGEMTAREAADWLRPHPAEAMEAYPVGSQVNSPRNESAEVIRPAVPPSNGMLFG